MSKVYAFLADGFEETEAVAVIDILLRAEIPTKIVSVMDDICVTGSHGIKICADVMFEDIDFSNGEMLFLPGGMPGKINLQEYEPLGKLLQDFNSEGKKIAAICAAPGILGRLNILNGKTATCFPGFEQELVGARISNEKVVVSKNIITGRGMGAAIEMGLAIVSILKDKETAEKIGRSIQFFI